MQKLTDGTIILHEILDHFMAGNKPNRTTITDDGAHYVCPSFISILVNKIQSSLSLWLPISVVHSDETLAWKYSFTSFRTASKKLNESTVCEKEDCQNMKF